MRAAPYLLRKGIQSFSGLSGFLWVKEPFLSDLEHSAFEVSAWP